MKKRIFIIILFVIFLGVVFVVFNGKNKDDAVITFAKKDEPDICKTNKCVYTSATYYPIIKVNTSNEELKRVVNKINKETNKRKQKMIKSDTLSKACENVSNKYNYSYLSNTNIKLYENSKYVSISVMRTDINLCTDESQNDKPEVYIYSKEKDKMLSQKEFQKELNISDDTLDRFISIAVDNNNKNMKTTYTYQNTFVNGKHDVMLFYDSFGKLKLYYYQSEIDNYNYTSIEND